MRRTLLGMSQEKLGEAIGLTFQQVQKYERGSNRISAGTLYRLGQVLDVPVSFFFDCYDDPHAPPRRSGPDDSIVTSDGVISRREARLLRLWRAAPTHVADEMLSLLGSLSPDLREARDDEMPVLVPVPSPQSSMLSPAPSFISPPAPKRTAATRDGMPRIKSDPADGGKTRRRHGAVWDPTDIYRAVKAAKASNVKSKAVKTPTPTDS